MSTGDPSRCDPFDSTARSTGDGGQRWRRRHHDASADPVTGDPAACHGLVGRTAAPQCWSGAVAGVVCPALAESSAPPRDLISRVGYAGCWVELPPPPRHVGSALLLRPVGGGNRRSPVMSAQRRLAAFKSIPRSSPVEAGEVGNRYGKLVEKVRRERSEGREVSTVSRQLLSKGGK